MLRADGLQGVVSLGGLPAQHDAVGAVQHGVGHVAALGAGGAGFLIMLSSICTRSGVRGQGTGSGPERRAGRAADLHGCLWLANEETNVDTNL